MVLGKYRSLGNLFLLLWVEVYSHAEEDGTRHVINDFIWEMSIRTISTKVEDVSHKNL